MRPFGLLFFGAAYASEEKPLPIDRCWQGNDNAPYCGCQLIFDTLNMINQTCTAQFNGANKVHMISVASSFAIPELSDSIGDKYTWTGYEGNSHENLHDILYFFEENECKNGTGHWITDFEGADWEPEVTCVPNIDANGDSYAVSGVRLGNYNYDIARSVQSYNVPIKNLAQGGSIAVTVNSQADSTVEPLELRNVTEHIGHGDANAEDCNNAGMFTFTQNPEHEGDLEYVKFELCDTICHPNENGPNNDYCFNVPSPWETVVQEV